MKAVEIHPGVHGLAADSSRVPGFRAKPVHRLRRPCRKGPGRVWLKIGSVCPSVDLCRKGRPRWCRWFLNGLRCDRVRSCIRPLVAAIDTAAGRYGDARIGCRPTDRARWLRHKHCALHPWFCGSFVLGIQRPPYTSGAQGQNTKVRRAYAIPVSGTRQSCSFIRVVQSPQAIQRHRHDLRGHWPVTSRFSGRQTVRPLAKRPSPARQCMFTETKEPPGIRSVQVSRFPRRRNQTMRRQIPAKSVDRPDALARKHLPRATRNGAGLRAFRLHRNNPPSQRCRHSLPGNI